MSMYASSVAVTAPDTGGVVTAKDGVKISEVEVNVTFPSGTFSSTPIIAATVIIDPSYGVGTFYDAYTVNVYNVTSSGFTARVYRCDNPGIGWQMPIQVGYIAMTN